MKNEKHMKNKWKKQKMKTTMKKWKNEKETDKETYKENDQNMKMTKNDKTW